MAQCAVRQVGVDLLENRVLATRLVGGDRVQLGGEERVETVCLEQGGLPVAFESVQFRDPPHDQTPDGTFGFVPGAERGEGHLNDLGGRDPFPGGLIPLFATVLALGQLPYLGRQNVLVGLLLVSVGLVVYALRSHSRPQDRDTHDNLVQRLETSQMRALRRPARKTESER